MPLYCSITGSTALREAEVQQPMMAATLSLTSSFFAFSAKVGQSDAPSSWMNLILRPSTPPMALICSMASFSACTEPVSEMDMVPVTECRMPTVTSVSVTARPVVLTTLVGNCWARDCFGSKAAADMAAVPRSSLRRRGDCRSAGGFLDIATPLKLALTEEARNPHSMESMLGRIVARQHTSLDVCPYAKARSKLLIYRAFQGLSQIARRVVDVHFFAAHT